MKTKSITSILAIVLLAAPGVTAQTAAQEHHKEHTRYKVIDTGSFGGPNSHSGSPVVRCVAVWRRTS